MSADNQQVTEMRISSDYIRGFVDGEGCFYILASRRIACEFQVSQKERTVLDEMQRFFGCGYVKPKYDRSGTHVFVVKRIADLAGVIVPFFKTNLLLVKRYDFECFAEAVELQRARAHLTREGRARIIELKSGTSETLRQASAHKAGRR